MSGGGLLEERLQLQLSREEAVHYMQSLIHESLGALFPQVLLTPVGGPPDSCGGAS